MKSTKVALLMSLLLGLGCGGGAELEPDAGLLDAGADAGSHDADGGEEEHCVPFADRFDEDTTIEKGCYLAERTPVIGDAVRLTLKPGVKVIFSEDVALRFTGEQVLVASGTADEPILLTGAQPQRGFWKGISFDGTLSTESRLDYVTVEYAGSTKSDSNAAAIKLTADSRGARASLTHTTLKDSQGWGLWLDGSAVVPEFASNVLTRNTLGPASVDAQVASVFDAASSYTGNDRDEVHVRAYKISRSATWQNLGVPYVMGSSLAVDGADWTIAPGVTLVMAERTGITVASDAALIAAGTSSAPIVFTGQKEERGSWKGIHFDGSNNPRNALAHVTVKWAGDTTSDQNAAALKLTADSRGVQVKISQTTLEESEGWGLWLDGSAVVPEFASNVLTRNTLGPASVDAQVADVLDADSSYTGNDRDEVHVRAYEISRSATWQNLGVPYVIESSLAVDGADWTIAPGVTLVMAEGTGITVRSDDSALIAAGTSSAPIVFTGQKEERGSWKGIHFDGSNNTRNALAHVTVKWAGDTTSDQDAAAVKLNADSHGVQARISQTTLEESEGWGLYLAASAIVPDFAGNTLTRNTLGPASVGSESAHQLLPSSSYVGNDVDEVRVRANRVREVTWLDLGVPYAIEGYVDVERVWTLSPGVTLVMREDARIHVAGDDAAFRAVGTAAQPITITGAEPRPGFWRDIVFDFATNDANVLDYCVVEYGGGGAASGVYGMITANSDSRGVSLSVTNSTIRHSAVYGIWLGATWSGTLQGNTMSGNALGDVFHDE